MPSGSVPLRVLLVKPGIDGHDVGIKVVASALRDAGMEVIYMGMRQMPDQIVKAAIDEGIDVIGLSFHSLAHQGITAEIIRLLREQNVSIPVIVGGSILQKHAEALKAMGVAETFGVEIPTSKIIDFIKQLTKH